MIHHPSRRFKAIASFVAAISILGLIGLAVNSLVIDSWLVGSLCFAMLLFGVNMLIALTARYVMKRTTAWPDKGRHLGVVAERKRRCLRSNAQSSHLYGAYLDDELAGMLFIDKVGADKPYARSSHAWFHAFVQTLDKILFKTVNSLNDAENRLVMSLDPKPNARIALMAVSSELAKLNIADKLFGTLEKDFAGCHIVYCAYGDEQHRTFIDNGYEPVASSILREKSDSVENELKLTLYMKNPREIGE